MKHTLTISTITAALLGMAAMAAAQTCGGDCDGDGRVTVDEVVTGITIALDQQSVLRCASLDPNVDQQVTIDELMTAVINALDGCPNRQRQAFVITTDFQTGAFGTVTHDGTRFVEGASPARQVNSDAVARTFGGRVYVVNRFNADNIQVLDPSHEFATVSQCSTGNGSNPVDIAFISATKAYVTLYGRTQLLIVNPSAPADCTGFELGMIDLSQFADADGIPEMDQM